MGAVVIVALRGVEAVGRGSDGRAVAVVVVDEVVPREARRQLQAGRLVLQPRDEATEVIVQILGLQEVNLLDLLRRAVGLRLREARQPHLGELLLGSVLVVVAVALGVVCREAERQPIAELLGELGLVVALLVVIGILAVARLGGWGAGIDVPSTVVSPAILSLILGAQPIPGDARTLLATEGQELEDAALPEVARLEEVGVSLRTASIHVAIGGGAPYTRLEGPVPSDTPRRGADLTAQRVEGACEDGDRRLGREGEVVRTQVEASAEGSRAIGRGADAALQLGILDAGGEVGHIGPEDALALRVIERYAVGHHIDPRSIYPAHTDVGVADAEARLTGGHDRGRLQEEVGDVHPEVGLL